MRIAVIIPACNIASVLRDALLSVLSQTHTDWFVVVVDDGSTDATADVVRGLADRRIQLVRQDNAGVSAARNRGIHQAEPSGPDAFLFLDGDDWLAPVALTLLADTLDDAPWAVAACGRFSRVAPDGTARLSRAPLDGCLLEPLLTSNLFANGGHLLIRRDAVQTAGDFRTDLSYGEDWDYWTRIALLGEFVAVRSVMAMLFVRERPGSVYRSRATDAAAYRPAIKAIYGNPAVATRLGPSRIARLRKQADAETAWSVGREMIRHGNRKDGQVWLGRSLLMAPNLKRVALAGLSWLGLGPFRRYQISTQECCLPPALL